MNYIKISILFSMAALITLVLLPEPQTFIKKKRGGPSVTECCDKGVDVLSLSADIVQDLGILQQQLIKISREMIDNNKNCYLAAADKEQLKVYYDRTQQCKNILDSLRVQVRSYTDYIKSLE